jgi:hypothetical protein
MKRFQLRNRFVWILIPLALGLACLAIAAMVGRPMPTSLETTNGNTDGFRLRQSTSHYGRYSSDSEWIEFRIPIGKRLFQFHTSNKAEKRDLQDAAPNANVSVTHTSTGEVWGLKVNDRVYRTPEQHFASQGNMVWTFAAFGAGLVAVAGLIALLTQSRPVAATPERFRAVVSRRQVKLGFIELAAAVLWGWVCLQFSFRYQAEGVLKLFVSLAIFIVSTGLAASIIHAIGSKLGGVGRVVVGLVAAVIPLLTTIVPEMRASERAERTRFSGVTSQSAPETRSELPAPTVNAEPLTPEPMLAKYKAESNIAPTQQSKTPHGPPDSVPPWFHMKKIGSDYELINTLGKPMYIVANHVLRREQAWARCPILFENESDGTKPRVRKGMVDSGKKYKATLLKEGCDPQFDKGMLEIILYDSDGQWELYKTDSAFIGDPIACPFAQCK